MLLVFQIRRFALGNCLLLNWRLNQDLLRRLDEGPSVRVFNDLEGCRGGQGVNEAVMEAAVQDKV